MALNSLFCADVPLSNYSLAQPPEMETLVGCFRSLLHSVRTTSSFALVLRVSKRGLIG